jgi:hypothetical protein
MMDRSGNLKVDDVFFTLPKGTKIRFIDVENNSIRARYYPPGSRVLSLKLSALPFTASFEILSIPGQSPQQVTDLNRRIRSEIPTEKMYISLNPKFYENDRANFTGIALSEPKTEAENSVSSNSSSNATVAPNRNKDELAGSTHSYIPNTQQIALLPLIPIRTDDLSENPTQTQTPTNNLTFTRVSFNELKVLNQYPGCDALVQPDPDRQKLLECSDSVSNSCGSHPKLNDKKQCITQIQSPVLKEFIALTRTAFGEATDNMKPADMMAVMKVVQNRTAKCPTLSASCDPWQIVLQPYQFSYLNNDRLGGSAALSARSTIPRMSKAVDAYLQFRTAQFSPAWNNVVNYHATYVNPRWSQRGSSLKLVPSQQLAVNGASIKQNGIHHVFYKNPNWMPPVQFYRNQENNYEAVPISFIHMGWRKHFC